MIKQLFLYAGTLILIIVTYLYLFGEVKTIKMIEDEYLSIFALLLICISLAFFKIKLKGYEIINFLPNNDNSLKSAVIFFLIFQVYDYFSEDGFLGMVSQWFLYWIMGVIALLLMQTINYYKNYKILKEQI